VYFCGGTVSEFPSSRRESTHHRNIQGRVLFLYDNCWSASVSEWHRVAVTRGECIRAEVQSSIDGNNCQLLPVKSSRIFSSLPPVA
jgi:hypothetical protein